MKARQLHEKLRDHLIASRAMDQTASDLMAELYAEIRVLERNVFYREQIADDLTEAINEGEP